ncbi:hypothetical protein [Phenylobacterium aquaticum]|uniref:hypothetical protein n=1 Tax=Phenylobacterium aquaticum TaxID=1763816 RepID=UPI001F5D67B6|nr:hypothetical protein [Phenylobacterium aquaticum]MCI3131715.1 hypothetical protein [Phenylobacterium aquaticum]
MGLGLAALPALIGPDPCGFQPTCEAVWNIWSMVGSLFPHILYMPIIFFLQRPLATLLLTLLLDVGLLAALWRALPPRIGLRTLLGVMAAWAAVTFVTDYYFPYLTDGALRLRALLGWPTS